MARRSERGDRRRTPAPVPTPANAPGLFDPADAAWLGERLRRLALGLTAAVGGTVLRQAGRAKV